MGHYVYKYVLNKEIIYIGKTDVDLAKRINQHGKPGDNISENAWKDLKMADIYYAELANSTMTDVVESELIRKYKPKYNKAKMSDWSGLNFVEPIWYVYKTEENGSDLENLQLQIRKYIKENDELKNKIIKIKDSEIANIRLELSSLYKDWDCYANIHEYSGEFFYITLDEVLEEYRNGKLPLSYISEAFDMEGNCICRKNIWTNCYDSLEFDFWQCNTDSVRGYIYGTRTDKSMSNYQILRNWKNRGSNMWIPCRFKKDNIKKI